VLFKTATANPSVHLSVTRWQLYRQNSIQQVLPLGRT